MGAPRGGNRGSFTKGDSRRKKRPRLGTGIPKDLREAFKARTPAALARLDELLKDKKAPSVAVMRAIELVLERGWGRVPLPVEAKTQESLVIIERPPRPTSTEG